MLSRFRERSVSISPENRLLIKRGIYISVFVVVLIFLTALLVWRLEFHGKTDSTIRSFWDGIWWAVVTIATVGYGDKIPITFLGRIVGLVLIVIGFILLSVITGLLASVFVEDRLKGAKGLKTISANHHLVLCGWNQSAAVLLQALVEKKISNREIVIVANQPVDFFETLETQFPSLRLRFVRGEPAQEEILCRAAVQNAQLVLILADQSLSPQSADDRSLAIANAVLYISKKIPVTVQLMKGANKNLLHSIGVDNVIVFDELGGYLLANTLLEKFYLTIYERLAKEQKQPLATAEIPESFVGKTYGELFDHFYQNNATLVLGLMTVEPELNINDIFADNASAIDQFIRSALTKAQKPAAERKTGICWNPPRDTVIRELETAIVIS